MPTSPYSLQYGVHTPALVTPLHRSENPPTAPTAHGAPQYGSPAIPAPFQYSYAPYLNPTAPVTPTPRVRSKSSYQLRREQPDVRGYQWSKDKVDAILVYITKQKWTISQFLWHFFQVYDKDGKTKVERTPRHRATVASLLRGNARYKMGQIIEQIYTHPAGQPRTDHVERGQMFLSTPAYTKLSHARVSLSAFAAQTCGDRIYRDATRAVKPASGLHAHVSVPRAVVPIHSTSPPSKKFIVTRRDIGRNVVAKVHSIISEECSLLYALCYRAAAKQPTREAVTRSTRPVPTVIAGAISSLLFTRNRSANLLPLAQALAFFAARAEQSLFRISSRFGTSVAYTTAYRALITLADGQETHLRQLAASNVVLLGIILDNAQHYANQYDQRAGRAPVMIKGVAATSFILQDCTISSHDLSNFLDAHKAGAGLRLTWDEIAATIDYDHLDLTAELHWVDVLVCSYESLACYRADVKHAFATEARKHQIPRSRRTVIHPLRSNSHDPSLATGLKDAVFELYGNQLGISKENWQPRLMFVGGDGGTFEGLVRIQKYLQVMPSGYDRMDWMVPILQLWHTKWTAISRIIFNCWGEGSERSTDVSCLGHNANLIGRKTPPNLKKVDFSRDSETLFIIGEARMRDCWREIFDVEDLDAHLKGLDAANKLPSFAELRCLAKRLHYSYSCERAYQQALDPRDRHNTDFAAPLGREWTPQRHYGPAGAAATVGVTGHVEDRGFKGDRQLANSIRLLKQFVEKREWFRSTSVGDIGSTWECVKNEIPECAGSGHNPNYLNYLLMMFCIIEIYCSLSLKEGLLNNWLVKLTDEENKFKEGDLMQEHEINQLDRHLQHKDRQYDEPFIRNVISPNLDLLVEIPRQMEEAVGLQARKTYHLSPHTRAETALLAEAFRKAQLHRFCEGRSAGYAHKNSTDIGVRRLQDGGDALAKFREFHGDLDALNSHSQREPIASETVHASAQLPDEQLAEAQGARTDGLLDELINDGSDEISPARTDDRTAVCISDGQLAVERSEPSTAAALDRELLDDEGSDKDIIRSDVDSESEDEEPN